MALYFAYIEKLLLYYVLFLSNLYWGYPFVIRVAVWVVMGVIVFTILGFVGMFHLFMRRHIERKTYREMHLLYADAVDEILLSERDMSQREISERLGTDANSLRTRSQKRWFARMVRDSAINITLSRRNQTNLQRLLELFGMRFFLEGEINKGRDYNKSRALRAMRIFDMPVSPFVITRLIRSRQQNIRRLANFSMIWTSASDQFGFFESHDFDDNFCQFDEIEFMHVLARLKRTGAAMPHLIDWVENDKIRRSKIMFVKAMQKYGDPEDAPRLVPYFKGTDDPKMKQAIVKAWGALGYTEAIPLMKRDYSHLPDNVRQSILEAMIQMSAPNEESFFLSVRSHSLNQELQLTADRYLNAHHFKVV